MTKTLICLLLCFSINAKSAETVALKFGIVPQQSATQLLELWAPLIQKMASDCKCKIDFQTAPDISSFENNVKAGLYDIVYLNPFHFVNYQSVGYNALVREDGRRLKGLVVVKNDSPIKNLEDLKDQQIAFPGPTSFAATILVQKLFEQKNIKITPTFVKSHESVYFNVIAGLMPAGGGINRTMDNLSAEDRAKLRILTTTQEVTPHPIAIHNRVSSQLRSEFLKTLTSLKDSPLGKNILEKLQLKPLVEAKNSDWDDVRKFMNDKR